VSGDARDDLYQVAALLDELERVLNPLAIEERGEIVSTPSVPPSLPQAPRGGGAGNASRGSSSPGPGQSRRSFDAPRGSAPLHGQAVRASRELPAVAPVPRRAPPPPVARRASKAASSTEVGERAPTIAGAPPTALAQVARASRVDAPPVPAVESAPTLPGARAVERPVAKRSAPPELTARVVPPSDDVAPAIPRARSVAPEPPMRVEDVDVPPPKTGSRSPERRSAPAAPPRRAHVRSLARRDLAERAPVDRPDAPALPGERIVIRHAPPSPAHRGTPPRAHSADERTTPRARRVPATGPSIVERSHGVVDQHHTAPPLPRRARAATDEWSEPTPPPAPIDPFEARPLLDEDPFEELEEASAVTPPAKIWLRGGRLRWTAGAAQIARADRALSRLVRRRGRRL